ncbi:MAG: restriction endonuclease subunit S [Methylotenera sp.]|uniref:restriction endonuclease subunit S n=1 Tax=Methylotenera sp. TaxID=2051956 RepID=UPI002727738D|nr:restriction endonuclease subunit S [Methylotenera sp.]MDO9150616.1 restriction endonuclease subunit S [Methylotenera sp.]
MSELKPYKLGDVVSFGNGKARPASEGNIPIYGGNGILGYCADNNYDGETIVIGRVGAYCGATYYENQPIWVSDNALSAKPKGRNNTKFFYYFLKDMDLNQHAGGSSHPLVTQTLLNSLDVEIVECPDEQKAIASVLSSLDDKIDLLHRQNTTLERMAETLFRQWFVEEAQEDWEEATLGEVATVQNGYAFSSGDYEEYQEGFLEVFKMGHIQPGGGLRFNPKADFVPRTEKLKRWTLNKNDIVMAMTDMKDNMGILGHPALIDVSEKYVLNQRVARIYLETTEKLKSIYLLYLQLNTEEAISLLQSKANSGVQVNLTTEAIKSIPVSLPPKFVQDKVLINIEPIFDKLSSNRFAVKTLEKLRDNLLPKLMSGEVRVAL